MINVGRGHRQQNAVLKQRNYGMGHIVQERLKATVSQAVQQHREAISVDGTEAEIWIRQSAGRKCTCQHSPAIISNSIDNQPFENETFDDDFGDDLVLEGYDDTYNPNETSEDRNNEPTKVLRGPVNNQNWMSEFNVGSNMEDMIQDSDTIQSIFNNDVSSLLFGGDKSPCPICYGTGFTEGYRLVNGKRVVCDATLPHEGLFTLSKETKPYSFDVAQGGYVEWYVEVPLYFEECMKISIYNGMVPINALIEFSIDHSNWLPLTYNNIKDLRSKVNKIWIKVIGIEPIKFTHLEIVYRVAPFPKVDMPNFAREQNFQFFEALMTTNCEISGNVPYIDRECVIGEANNGFLWKVVSATPNTTGSRQLFKTDCELRLIQRSEALFLLSCLYRPYLIYNQRGLERMQGLENYIQRSYNDIPR